MTWVDRVAEIQVTSRVHREALGLVEHDQSGSTARDRRSVGGNVWIRPLHTSDGVDCTVRRENLTDDVVVVRRRRCTGLCVRVAVLVEVVAEISEEDVVAAVDEHIERTVHRAGNGGRTIGGIAARRRRSGKSHQLHPRNDRCCSPRGGRLRDRLEERQRRSR